MKATIRHIGLASLGRMGCLLGMVAAFLPSVLVGLAGLLLTHLARRWLLSWQAMDISVLGQHIARVDLVHLLGLEQVLDLLQTLSAASIPVLFLAILVLALVTGILLALMVILVGLAYNLLAAATGGIVVEMAAVDPAPRRERQAPRIEEKPGKPPSSHN